MDLVINLRALSKFFYFMKYSLILASPVLATTNLLAAHWNLVQLLGCPNSPKRTGSVL